LDGLSSLLRQLREGGGIDRSDTYNHHKMVAASVSLGSGASLGPEGSVEMAQFWRAACSSAANVPRATTLALGAGLLLAKQLGLMSLVFSLP